MQMDDPARAPLPDGGCPPDGAFGPQLSIDYVKGFFGMERALDLLRGTDPHAATPPLPRSISGVEFWKLCVADLAKHNDEAHGCTHQPLPRYTGTMLFAAINEMDTVKEALQLLTKLLKALPAGIGARLAFTPNELLIHYQIASPSPDGQSSRRDRFLEMFALVVHCVLRWGTAQAFRPTAIRRSARLKDCEGSLLDGLGERYHRHGTGVTVHYARAILPLPMGMRKYRYRERPELSAFLDIVRDYAWVASSDRDTTPSRLRALLSEGPLSKSRAAAALGISVATLQRRLADAGTSFRAVSQNLRRAKLEMLLRTSQPLDDIAEELGFSDRRALCRACQQWLGLSPTQYRAARGEGRLACSPEPVPMPAARPSTAPQLEKPQANAATCRFDFRR